MKVSLCMIVKNEELHLGECLNSAKNCVDEIVIVDTGSTDRTLEIAKEHGAKIYHFSWEDDFSKARNFALQQCEGPWVLWLDADETIKQGSGEYIRECVKNPNIAGYHLKFVNIQEGSEDLTLQFLRLFRKIEGVHWENVIHEQILTSVQKVAVEKNLSIESCNAVIQHHASPDYAPTKKDFYRRLFQKQLQLTPNDPYVWHKYGEFIIDSSKKEAKASFNKSLDLMISLPQAEKSKFPFAGDSALQLALIYQEEDDAPKAWDALNIPITHQLPISKNYLFGRGVLEKQNQNWANATECFEKCIQDTAPQLVPFPWGIDGALSYLHLGECFSEQNEAEKSQACYLKAVEKAPTHLNVIMEAVKGLAKHSLWAECIEIFQQYLEKTPDPPPLWEKAGEPMLKIILEAASRVHPVVAQPRGRTA